MKTRNDSDGGMGRQAIVDPEAGNANKLFTMSASDPDVSAQHDRWGHTPKTAIYEPTFTVPKQLKATGFARRCERTLRISGTSEHAKAWNERSRPLIIGAAKTCAIRVRALIEVEDWTAFTPVKCETPTHSLS